MGFDLFFDPLELVDPLGEEFDQLEDLYFRTPFLNGIGDRSVLRYGVGECVLRLPEGVLLGDEDVEGLIIVKHIRKADLVSADFLVFPVEGGQKFHFFGESGILDVRGCPFGLLQIS